MDKEKIKNELETLPSVSRVETEDFNCSVFLKEEKLKENPRFLFEVKEYLTAQSISCFFNPDRTAWEFLFI